MRTVGRIAVVVGWLVILACGCRDSQPSVTVACAAGWQTTVEPWLEQWSQETGVRVRTTYDGSGRLVATVRSGAAFDVILASDESYLNTLAADGLVNEPVLLAEQRLRLVHRVGRDQPTWDDVIAGRTRLSLAHDTTAAVSRVARDHLGDDVWGQLESAAVTHRVTVTEVAADVAVLDVADVGLIWDTTWPSDQRLQTIPVAELDGATGHVTIAIVPSPRTDNAERLVAFLQNRFERVQSGKITTR